MKKLVVSTLLVALVILGMPLNAAVPVCVLGGPTAMDTNRQLAEGETMMVTDRPLVVNLRFNPTKEHPEQVGECMLPSKSKVAVKNGILQWVEECGNDEVNKNIFVLPFRTLHGLRGKPGRNGYTPVKGVDYRDGIDGRNFTPNLVVKKKSHTVLYVVGAAILVGAGIALASGGGGHKKEGPVVTTLPPCTQLPCN